MKQDYKSRTVHASGTHLCPPAFALSKDLTVCTLCKAVLGKNSFELPDKLAELLCKAKELFIDSQTNAILSQNSSFYFTSLSLCLSLSVSLSLWHW